MIKIEFCTDNAAFEGPALYHEVSRILDRLSATALDGLPCNPRPIRDLNGNIIGHWQFIENALPVVED